MLFGNTLFEKLRFPHRSFFYASFPKGGRCDKLNAERAGQSRRLDPAEADAAKVQSGRRKTQNTQNPDKPGCSRGPAVSSGNSQEQQEYVVNVRSRIFHYPYCDSVKKMKEKNRQNFTGKRDQLIDKGYKPCQNCNP